MASFSDGYRNASQLLQLTTSLLNSGKYILDPDLRAQKVSSVINLQLYPDLKTKVIMHKYCNYGIV